MNFEGADLSNLNSKHILNLFNFWLSFAETMFLCNVLILCLNTVD